MVIKREATGPKSEKRCGSDTTADVADKRGYKPRKTSGLQKLEKAKKQILP